MDTFTLILLTTIPPLACFVIAIIFLVQQPRIAQGLVLFGSTVSLLAAIGLLVQGPVEPLRFLWFQSGAIQLQFGFILDGASLMFGVVVTFITACIMLYSTGYMAHDPSKTRYFALLSFFAWSMLSFVYAVDLLQSFIFWELIGLSSFFLIGFWFEKPEAAGAARKAFLMTRVGDVGPLHRHSDHPPTRSKLRYPQPLRPSIGPLNTDIARPAQHNHTAHLHRYHGQKRAIPIAHLATRRNGRSPQPVSALLHSATMVAAGVFLMIRLHPLFMAAQDTALIILSIATFTAILSSTIAMVDTDIKKVLAYSSISQLGFMLMALAAGSLFAGVFHLITHAIYKALLFLCSGIYIHAYHTNSMAEIGRSGGRHLKITTLGLIIGGAALSGIPPLAGFWSKEEIFAQLGHNGFTIYMAGAFLAAFLTAYYTFRMIFLITKPDRAPASDHSHSEPLNMKAPVLLLTLGAIVLGFFGTNIAHGLGLIPQHHSIYLLIPTVGIVILGILIAYFDYGRANAPRTGFISKIAPLNTLFTNKWYIDDIYRVTIVAITHALSRILHWIENHILDGNYDRFGLGILRTGAKSTRVQSGWMQLYLGWAIILLAVVALYLGLR